MAKKTYIIKNTNDWVELTKVANSALNKYGEFQATLSKVSTQRSLKQNAYLWGVVYATLKEFFLTQNDQNLDPDEIHEYCKMEFGYDKLIYMPNGRTKVIPKSTSDYSTQEFSDYVARIRAHFALFGLDIPEPEKDVTEEKD